MGILRTSTSCGLGMDEEGETADVGEPDGDEKAVSTLPVLRVSCDSRRMLEGEGRRARG